MADRSDEEPEVSQDAPPGDITLVLQRIDVGDERAAEDLLPIVYGELRRLAAAKMKGRPSGVTLQPTALVHEAWLKVGVDGRPKWRGREHFFAASAEAMRQILIDRARRRLAQRHGGGQARVDLEGLEIAAAADDTRLLQVNEVLERFANEDPRKAELVKLRYFVGLSLEEAADALDISRPTAVRWWAYCRAWFIQELDGEF